MTAKLTNGEAGLGGMLYGALIFGLIGHYFNLTAIGVVLGALIRLFGGIHGNDPIFIDPECKEEE